MKTIRENGGFVLASFDYDQLGRRERLTLGNGAVTRYEYDAVSRLWKLSHDLNGTDTASDNIITLAYNPASQIVKREATNSLYAWTGHGSGTTGYTADGLNRLTSQTTGGSTLTFAHDARGNRVNDEARSYVYDSENRGRGLASTPFHYDPLGRLSGAGNAPGSAPAIAYENYVDNLIAERVPGNATPSRRHVFGPGTDEPLVWYEGSDRRFLTADERGSIVAVTGSSGAILSINRYDEYGRPQTTSFNHGRFLYTGQRWFSGFGLYHYKNRMYDPDTGRFMQPDPIGYGDGPNRYAYVGGDPVNLVDPLGLSEQCFYAKVRAGKVEDLGGGDTGITSGKFQYMCYQLETGGHGPTQYFDGASGGGGGGDSQPLCLVPPVPIAPSPETTSRAVNQALREIYGQRGGPVSTPMSSDFSRLGAIPDFSQGGWRESTSGHAGYAWELPIPSKPEYVVKVYINDRNFEGVTSVAITSPTNTLAHALEYAINVVTGYVGNAQRAVEYLTGRQPCR